MDIDYSHGMDKGQRTQRRNVRLKDQFGRLWGCSIEKSTGDPCTGISPFGGWADPLGTPDAYLRVPKHDDGTPRAGEIEVDFDRWISSVQGSMDDWNLAISVAGKVEYKNYTPKDRKEWYSDPILRALAGPEPSPTVETLTKAMNGDPDLLGLPKKEVIQDPVREVVEEAGEDLRNAGWTEFQKSMKGKGFNMTQLAAMYRVSKVPVPA